MIELIRKFYYFPKNFIYLLEAWRISKGKISFNSKGLNRNKREIHEVIVSLTSFPGRIDLVPGVISSLLRQTFKPDRIILWLGEEKFPNKKLPNIFNRILKCGVEVKFRKDLKSHTKYFYVMQEFPESIIITVDDDRIYNCKLIETLVKSYIKHPTMVSANRVHLMTFDEDGRLNSYKDWIYEYPNHVGNFSFKYFATGVGGVLYPPHILCNETFNLKVIQNLCHNHDDMWLKIMEVLSGVKVIIAADAKKSLSHNIYNSQITGQYIENVIQGGNDLQSKAVISYYNDCSGIGTSLETVIFEDL